MKDQKREEAKSGVRLCIHRAADAIGGNCIEIAASTGERLLLDAGRPLDTPEGEPTPIPPTLDTTMSVAGVLLSHAHADHCGLLETLPADWPVYCGQATERLLRLSAAIGQKPLAQGLAHWEDGKAMPIGPFTVMPHRIDHSAFDAYALQIDVEGKTILYSGDFRAHGRESERTERLMQNPPEQVDVLIMEGTNLPAMRRERLMMRRGRPLLTEREVDAALRGIPGIQGEQGPQLLTEREVNAAPRWDRPQYTTSTVTVAELEEWVEAEVEAMPPDPLMEALFRRYAPKPTATEAELEEQFTGLFKKCQGRVFVSWSSTNIDRAVTLYNACKNSGRVLVPDLYCLVVLMRLGEFDKKIPQPEWEGGHMRAVVTNKMKFVMERLGEPDLVEYLKRHHAAMSARALADNPERWVIMARGSLLNDYAAKGVIPNEQDALVWSMWEGYLRLESSQALRKFFAPCRYEYIHSSGHASPEVLRRFAEAMRPKMLIPVHGEAWEDHKGNFPAAHILPNGTWMNL